MSSEDPRRLDEPLTPTRFREACGRFATGVAIAGAMDRSGVPHGLTVNSFSSVSLDPPLVLICLAHTATAIEVFRGATHFGLSLLSAHQKELSDRFARKDSDRFDGVQWRRGITGVPLLAESLAEIECAMKHIVRAGDHDIFIGQMVHATIREGEPLIYYASRYRKLE